MLNADGTVQSNQKISDAEGGFGGTLANDDRLGSALTRVGDLNGDGIIDLAVGAYGDDDGGTGRGAVWVLSLDEIADFGDAPDTSAGTGAGNYQTRVTDGGPSHQIVSGLLLGATIDGDPGTLQNANADNDNTDGALPNDEDGVLSPLDLLGTVGAQPTVTLLATNTTGSAATLSGWIDYNQDGDFDNATERAQIAVPDATTDGRFTLSFPAIPAGATGKTYARFRLSTDAAADNSTGAATDGEVEDYLFSITTTSNGTVQDEAKISAIAGGFAGIFTGLDHFGSSVTSLGDLNNDGITDLFVGADANSTVGSDRGAGWVLFMTADGTVATEQKISIGGLDNSDRFGASVANLGDLNGDGVTDVAVGARLDDDGGTNRGAVHILFLNSNGQVASTQKISDSTGGLAATLDNEDRFGRSLASAGDLDGDGVTDLVVGAYLDDDGGNSRGAVYVLFLNSDGSVRAEQKISDTSGGLAGGLIDEDRFGNSVASLGDLDGDGVGDIAVGAYRDDDGGGGRGAVYILFLNDDGTVKAQQKISDGSGGLTASLDDGDFFGSSVAAAGDIDADGVVDLAVGAAFDDDGGSDRGAVHLLLLNNNGTVKAER